MIEQAMYFALGFLVAALLALMFLPAFWRRAMRLSMRRLQMLAPMSMEEVVAERDLLRAEFAVRERRLEQEMEALQAARANDMAAAGRYAANVAEAREWLKKAETMHRDMQEQIDDAQKTVAERTELLRSTEMALHEMTERAERGVARLRAPEDDNEEHDHEAEVAQVRASVHETRTGAIHEENIRLEQEVEKLRADYARLTPFAARATLANRDLIRHKEDNARLTQELAQMSAERQELLKNLHDSRADVAMLNDALDALRAKQPRRRGSASAENDGAPLREQDVAALRETITQFGDRVIAADKTTTPPQG